MQRLSTYPYYTYCIKWSIPLNIFYDFSFIFLLHLCFFFRHFPLLLSSFQLPPFLFLSFLSFSIEIIIYCLLNIDFTRIDSSVVWDKWPSTDRWWSVDLYNSYNNRSSHIMFNRMRCWSAAMCLVISILVCALCIFCWMHSNQLQSNSSILRLILLS